MFSRIKGQDKAILLLQNAMRHDRVAQAYLFHGPEGVGKFSTALFFGMALNCLSAAGKRPCGACTSCHKFLEFSHPDLIYVFPTPSISSNDEGDLTNSAVNEYLTFIENRKSTPWEKVYFSKATQLRKESIAFLQKRLSSSQREGRYRICIIEDADEMNQHTANSFLKLLEEPPTNTVQILITTKIASIMPTILSRCQTVFFKPVPHKVIEDILMIDYLVDKKQARSYSKIANGNVEQALRLVNDDKHEARSLMVSILEAAVKNDDIALITMLEGGKDKLKADVMHDVLSHLVLFINDVALSRVGSDEVSNIDLKDLLLSFMGQNNLGDSDFADITNYFDDLHNKIDGKVNLQFILVNLYNRIKSLMA